MAGTLTIKSGDTEVITLTFTDADGVAVDLTDCTVKLGIKAKKTDSDAAALYLNEDVTITDASGGIAVDTISAATTAALTPQDCYWQARYIDASLQVFSTDIGACKIISNLIDDE